MQQLQQLMEEDGSREELKRLLKERLMEAAWTRDITRHCQVLVESRGLANTRVEDLVTAAQQKAMESIPMEVRKEMMERIRDSLVDRAIAAEQAAAAAAAGTHSMTATSMHTHEQNRPADRSVGTTQSQGHKANTS